MRGAARRATVAASILLGSAVASAVQAKPGDPESWVRVDTPGAVIFSDADPQQVTQIAVRLERLRRVLLLAGGRIAPRSPRPLHAYVFRDWGSAKTYLQDPTIGGRVGGMFVGRAEADYLIVAASPELDPHALIYHEFLHAVVRETFPQAPLWFNEGLAEVFGTFWVNDHDAVVGTENLEHLASLRARAPLPWPELFRARPDSQVYREAAAKQRFHAQSWLLVHWLLLGPTEPDGGPRLGARLERLAAADGSLAWSPEAIDAAFPALRHELSAYLGRSELPQLHLQLSSRVADVRTELRRLSPQEALYRLGDLLAHLDGAPEKAARHYARALELDPAHVPSAARLGRIRAEQGRYDEALQLLRTALAGAGDDAAWSLRIQRDLTETSARLADDLVQGGHIQQALRTLRVGLAEIRALALREEFERRIEAVLTPPSAAAPASSD
jgi:tetratricopeptide (TPR) repeat protein